MLLFRFQPKQQERQVDQIHLPKNVWTEHVAFLIQVLTFSSSVLTGRFGGSQSGLGRDVASGCHG